MKHWFCFVSVLFLATAALAYDSILINQSRMEIKVAEFADYLQISEESQTIQEVTRPNISRQFTPIHGDDLKFNQLEQGAWLTFAVNNPIGRPTKLYLVIDAPFIDTAELYYDIYSPLGYRRIISGSSLPYSKRPYQMGNVVLPMDIFPGEQQVFLKITAIEPVNMNIRLVDEATLLAASRNQIILTALWLSLLVGCFGAALLAYYRFRMPAPIWAATMTTGIIVHLSGWNGSIAWLVSWLGSVEVIAINAGAFLSIASMAYLLRHIRVDNITSWLDDALIWLGRVFLALSLTSLFPLSNQILAVQIILLPVAMTVLAIFWFEQRPTTMAEQIALVGFSAFLLYLSLTILLLIGMTSLYPMQIVILCLLALVIATTLVWAAWLAAKVKGSRIAVEGVDLPRIHWPLLRKLNHDIRGPINGVLGMTELLQDTTLSAHQQEFVNTIQTAGFSLLREADQLQNLIRIGLNKLPESEDEFDLYDLIEDTVQPFSRIAHSKQLELVLDIAPEIPTRYRGNAHIIGQILANLIDNALKYTDHGEVLLQVKPWQQGRIRFSITDTGPGIARDSKNVLFQFPESADDIQPKDVHMGLPICKYLVSLLGGQLSLSSELRMGTTFWVDIPLTVARSQASALPNNQLSIEDLRIMVVDDNLTCRKVIEHLALSWGAEVLSMSNGQSAMANLHNQYHKGEPVDVLILDQKMPTMNGTEMAQRIRQDDGLNKDIVILMMTGSDDVSGDLENSNTGIEFVMSKPISGRTLRETLKLAAPSIAKNRENAHAKKSLSY